MLSLRTVTDPVTGAMLIAFSSADAGFGIGTVEMRAKKWWMWGAWQPVTSPAVYPRGASMVELKATSAAGRVSVQEVSGPGLSASSEALIALAVIFLAGIAILILVRRRRARAPQPPLI